MLQESPWNISSAKRKTPRIIFMLISPPLSPKAVNTGKDRLENTFFN